MKSVNPFNLISTPVPMLPNTGIRTQIGISSEDPEGHRHLGLSFDLWLTVYSPEGRLLSRKKIDTLEASQRRFYDFSQMTESFQIKEPHLCVIHRIPTSFKVHSADTTTVQIPADFNTDFEMYRVIVQLIHPKGGRGSVIYEIPSNFNANGRGSLLVHSNQAVVGRDRDTLVLFLNYSTDPAYSKKVPRKVTVYRPDGSIEAQDNAEVYPFGMDVLSFLKLIPSAGDLENPKQLSFIGTSKDSILIPLIVNIDHEVGGINIEHTHSPHSFLGMPFGLMNDVRKKAIQYHSEKNV